MTRSELLFTARLIASATALVIPLLGCFGGAPPPAGPTRCEGMAADWTPERIEILDMTDDMDVEMSGRLGIVAGGQGSDMAGIYVVVYGDDIPQCLGTTVDLAGYGSDYRVWDFQPDGPRRATIDNPYYWIVSDGGASSRVTVTIGGTTVGYDVDVN